jgi:hypothetical protein
MLEDEIIQEVRANREAYAERFNFDISAIYRAAKENEGKDGRKVVFLPPRRTAVPPERESR